MSDHPKPIAAVILAAGQSRRMGRPKLLLPWGRGLLVDAVLSQVSQAGFDRAVLVSGAWRQQVEARAALYNTACAYNPDYGRGQSTSLQAGLTWLRGQSPQAAAMFIPADQPWLSSQLLDRLIAAWQQCSQPILLPRFSNGQRGNPAIFSPSLFPQLMQIKGDVGGRPLLQAHPELIAYLDLEDRAVLLDIDDEADYMKARGGDHGPEDVLSDSHS